MDTKRITIVVAGTGGEREYKDVALLRGTKVRDVLSKLGLQGFQLTKPDGGAFGNNDNLFDAIADGQKLIATKADVEAGLHGLVPR